MSGQHAHSLIALVTIVASGWIGGACGARTGLSIPDAAVPHDAPMALTCAPVDDACGAREVCGNGEDDDCNGQVDEGCACDPGRTQPCFAGPPGRRNVGVCSDGTQTCRAGGTWGACIGGVVPHHEGTCDGADNECTGCSHDTQCPIACPSADDVRIPRAQPFAPYPLDGGAFFAGAARSWQWSIRGGPCDALSTIPSYLLQDPTSQHAIFTPRLSGDYRVTLAVVTQSGETLSCSWIVHVAGPGLRVEMCYPENTSRDLDLYMHRANDTGPWFDPGTANVYSASADVCSWHNCEAHLRSYVGTTQLSRADWGYAYSPVAECIHGPYGAEWARLGYCGNPRLDIDNNLVEATGVPENINLDNPREGDTFRIMVQNFTGSLAHPLVNVYCGGRRVATYGESPDTVPAFEGNHGATNFGAMWRVADVTTHVNARGDTTSCDTALLHRPGERRGYFVTYDDPSY